MASIGFLLTSVISLFFSLIFSTEIFQRKLWSNMYVSISLFFFSITSFSLFIGHVFTWYPWIVNLFFIGYALVIPNLLGIALRQVAHKFYPAYTLQVSIGYGAILFILAISYMTQIFSSDLSFLDSTNKVLALAWLREQISLYFWLTGLSTIMFILFSLWLWMRREGVHWLWFSISGLFFFFIDQMLGNQLLGSLFFSLLWLILLFCIWRAASIDFPLDLAKANEKEEER